jgi:hypothetical protein
MHLIRETELCRPAKVLALAAERRTLYSRIDAGRIQDGKGGRGPRYSVVVGLFTSKSWPQALPSLEEAARGLYRSP